MSIIKGMIIKAIYEYHNKKERDYSITSNSTSACNPEVSYSLHEVLEIGDYITNKLEGLISDNLIKEKK